MVLPFIEVLHLASSSSFYASILQPLGLHYLSENRDPSSVDTITFGIPAGNPPARAQSTGRGGSVPVLQIREKSHPFEPLRISTLALAAPSPAAVADFHACALTANPWLLLQGDGDSDPSNPGVRPRLGIEGGVSPTQATVRDLDGNTIQALFSPPTPGIFNPWDNRLEARSGDPGLILDWKHEGATGRSIHPHHRSRSQSHPHLSTGTTAPASFFSHPFQANPRPPSATATMPNGSPSQALDDGEDFQASLSPRHSSSGNGLSTTAVVGALLGVAAGAAAGAAFTYNMVSKERDRRPHHEIDPPSLPRRATYPEKMPPAPRSLYSDMGPVPTNFPPKMLPYRPAPAYPQFPASYPDEYPPRQLSYQDNFAPRKMPTTDESLERRPPYEDDSSDVSSIHETPRRPARLLTESEHYNTKARSVAKSTTKSIARSTTQSTTRSTTSRTARSTTRSHEKSSPKKSSYNPDVGDEQGKHSRRSSRHSSSSSRVTASRSRSEAPSERASLVLVDADRHSRVESRLSTTQKSSHSQSRSHRPHRDPERDSYFSARSRRSSAVVRQPPLMESDTEVPELPEMPIAPAVPDAPTGSRASRTSSRRSRAREPPDDEYHISPGYGSKAHSHVSARHVALPPSAVGSSHANWEDDMESVAPSDSISCVGSKTSRRSRRAR